MEMLDLGIPQGQVAETVKKGILGLINFLI